MSQDHNQHPHLTENVEKKLRSMIELQELNAQLNVKVMEPKLYLQLADLYHFHQNYSAEIEILQRYVDLKQADKSEVVDIMERIESVAGVSQHTPVVEASARELSLVEEADDNEQHVVDLSTAKAIPRVNENKTPFEQETLKVLAVCAAYTGRSDDDEIVQLALLLFEYKATRNKAIKMLETYWARCNPQVKVPAKVSNQFHFSQETDQLPLMDSEQVVSLFQQADFVVSHNDAEIERKLLVPMIPEISRVSWYSSEKDIPWRALGFDNSRLTQLSRALGDKLPRTCMERVVAIRQLLGKAEPNSQHVYLERLYNMQPMKAFEWTPSLQSKSKKYQQKSSHKGFWLVILCGIVLTAAAIYLQMV